MLQNLVCGLPAPGTTAWTAPELISDPDASYNKSCDVFSYGVILWELATRRIPWHRADRVINDAQIGIFVGNGKRETIPEEAPPTYAKLIANCWAQCAKDRPVIETVVQTMEQNRHEVVPPEIPESYQCPISYDIMQDPVMDREGHTFERVNIEKWIGTHHNCPLGREPLALTDLSPNRALRDAIEKFLEANPSMRPKCNLK